MARVWWSESGVIAVTILQPVVSGAEIVNFRDGDGASEILHLASSWTQEYDARRGALVPMRYPGGSTSSQWLRLSVLVRSRLTLGQFAERFRID